MECGCQWAGLLEANSESGLGEEDDLLGEVNGLGCAEALQVVGYGGSQSFANKTRTVKKKQEQ